MRRVFLVLAALVVCAVPMFADEPLAPNGNVQCELSGTWYGGSLNWAPYLMTVTANGAGRYSVVWQMVAAPASVGYDYISTWSGEIARTGPNRYEAWAILFAKLNPDVAAELGIDPTLPELDYVHSTFSFTDCNTLANVIDTFAWYNNFDFTSGMVPFVTEPDVQVLPEGVTLEEVYYRMPTGGRGPNAFATPGLHDTIMSRSHDARKTLGRKSN